VHKSLIKCINLEKKFWKNMNCGIFVLRNHTSVCIWIQIYYNYRFSFEYTDLTFIVTGFFSSSKLSKINFFQYFFGIFSVHKSLIKCINLEKKFWKNMNCGIFVLRNHTSVCICISNCLYFMLWPESWLYLYEWQLYQGIYKNQT
jgi:hypothetical protein